MKKVTPPEGDPSPAPGLPSSECPGGGFGAGGAEEQPGWLEGWFGCQCYSVPADTSFHLAGTTSLSDPTLFVGIS